MPDTKIEIESFKKILTPNTTVETGTQITDNPEIQAEVSHRDVKGFYGRISILSLPAIFSTYNSDNNSEAPSRPRRLDVKSIIEDFLLIACIMTIIFVISIILINNSVLNQIYSSLCFIALIPPILFAIKGRLTNEISIRWVCCYLAVIIFLTSCIIYFKLKSEDWQKMNLNVLRHWW